MKKFNTQKHKKSIQSLSETFCCKTQSLEPHVIGSIVNAAADHVTNISANTESLVCCVFRLR